MPISAVLDRVWPVTLSASDLQGIPKLSIEAVVRGPSLVLLRRSVSLPSSCACSVPAYQGLSSLEAKVLQGYGQDLAFLL